jgi:hypothetical protein
MTFLLSLSSFWGCEFSVLNCKTHMYSTEEETDMAVELEARCRVKYVADLDCCISEQFSCWALASSKLVLKLDSTKPKGSFSHIVLWILHWVVQFSLLRCGIIRKLIQWIPVANRMSFVTGWRFCVMVCSDFGQIVICFICTHCQELMKSVGSHGNLSMLFMMKVMVWHFVSDFLSYGYAYSHCCVTFKLLLWKFHCNFIDIIMHDLYDAWDRMSKVG